jgi:hypothetical protein
LFIIPSVFIFKEGIINDHWNVFMKGREEDDLREMGPSSLAWAGLSKLCGVGLSSIGGVELTQKCKKERFGSWGSKHKNKDEPFFSRECLFCIHRTIINWFQGVSDTRLTRAFLSHNIQGINDYKRFVESKLENKVFKKDFEHEKYVWRPNNLNISKRRRYKVQPML